MLSVGGLKAAAKRTAFGDVSNTAKTISSTHDDSTVPGKPMDFVKPLVLQEKSAGFLRPAQRPLNTAGAKIHLNNTSVSEATSISTNKAPLGESRPTQPQPLALPANKRTLSKRNTTIYKDNAEVEQPVQAVTRPESAPTAPVHQNLAPRHQKSQPQMRTDQPPLRRTLSKFTGVEQSENVIPSDSADQDAFGEEMVESDEAYQSYLKMMEQSNKLEEIEVSKATQAAVDRLHQQLPVPPLASEPEEYWEEEEEEEIYDEQGYTTAHSYRSRGENTTGGATTVLFPKVTNKAKKELAAAKDLVESSRTTEEIEDEAWDTSMVAEYGDEIFAYMRELEVRSLLCSF
jgi:hypothetical protein